MLFLFCFLVCLFVMPEFVVMQSSCVFCLSCLFVFNYHIGYPSLFFCELPIHIFGPFKKWVVCGFLIDFQEFLLFYWWYLFVSYICCRLCVHTWFWILTLLKVPFIVKKNVILIVKCINCFLKALYIYLKNLFLPFCKKYGFDIKVSVKPECLTCYHIMSFNLLYFDY